MRSRTRRVAFALLLTASVAALPGCAIKLDGNFAKIFKKVYQLAAAIYGLSLGQCTPVFTDIGDAIDVTFEWAPEPPPAPGSKPTRNYYLAFEGTGQRNNAFVRPDYTLQGAFDVQFSTGQMDPERPLPPASMGAFWAGELDLVDSDPLQFVAAGFQHVESPLGTQVFVATEAGTQGSLFLPGATRVDARLTSDGKGSLSVWARPAFAPTFLEVDTIAIDLGVQYQLGLGVVGLGDGEQVGFDDAQVLANGPTGAAEGSAQQASDRAWAAALHIADAHRLIDGSAPDQAPNQAEAAQHLHDAEALIDQVAAYADQPGETDKSKKQLLGLVLTNAKLARGLLHKAADQLEHGKPVQKVRKTLTKALGDVSDAMSALEVLANISH